jgi:hypothetical protein
VPRFKLFSFFGILYSKKTVSCESRVYDLASLPKPLDK